MFPCAEHETKLQCKSHYGFALAPFSIPSPIAWCRSIWAFFTMLGLLALLQAGLFAVAQGNQGKAGEATCQGAGRRWGVG